MLDAADAMRAYAAAAAQRASLIRHTDAFESSNTGGEGARRAAAGECCFVGGWMESKVDLHVARVGIFRDRYTV